MSDEASPHAPTLRPFVAIDFETADYGADSACALALIVARGGQIVERVSMLIQPPRRAFVFTWVHGLTWKHVAHEPPFAAHWPRIQAAIEGADFIAAHNASFDQGVMRACCGAAGFAPPAHPSLCTVKLARRAWQLRPANLPAVCRHLALPLKHHDALSDAEACARIVLAADASHIEALLAPPAPPTSRRRPRAPRTDPT
jgi:DNA polymerase-3 subunit epsilon